VTDIDFLEQSRLIRKKMLDGYRDNDLEKSLANGRRLIELHAVSRAEPCMERADDFYNYAYICGEAGDYDKAIDMYTKSYVTVRHLTGESADFADRIVNLAICHCKSGNGSAELSVGLFKKACELIFELKGENDPEYKDTLYNLANAYMEAGIYELGIEAHRKHIYLRGQDDMDCADSFNCIGYAYEEQGKFKSACGCFKEALKIKKRLMGECEPEYITDYIYYADVTRKAGDNRKAMGIFVRAAGLIKKSSSEYNPLYTRVIVLAAESAHAEGDHGKALKYRKRVTTLTQRILGADNLFYAQCLKKVAESYEALGENQKSGEYIYASVSILKRLLGDSNGLYINELVLSCNKLIKGGMKDEVISLIGDSFTHLNVGDKAKMEMLLEVIKKFSQNGQNYGTIGETGNDVEI
jgi:tetratricopeptide (TPR) repeat protein